MSKARNFAASAPCDGREHRTCQKGHYNLEQLKARTEQTEILYIFFGIHTANVVQLADRIEQRAQLADFGIENMHMETCFHRENYASAIENGQTIRPKRPE